MATHRYPVINDAGIVVNVVIYDDDLSAGWQPRSGTLLKVEGGDPGTLWLPEEEIFVRADDPRHPAYAPDGDG